MPQSSYKTTGINNLEKALTQLGENAGGAALAGALRDASKPVIMASRRACPKDSGDTAKSIRSEVFKGKGRGKTDSVATLQIGFHKTKGWKGRFIEGGVKSHTIPKKPFKKGRKKRVVVVFGQDAVFSSAVHPGKKAHPVLLPAFEQSYRKTTPIFIKRLRERIILQAIKKYGKSA